MNSQSEIVHICWTGGWDSTFRLLQLILSEKKTVQPHYVLWGQECTGSEINTISNIQRTLFRDNHELRHLILPIKYIDVRSIGKDEVITKEFNEINAKMFLAEQYEILARYCISNNIANMELGILSGERYSYFKDNTLIFKYFELPLLGLKKREIAGIAKNNGWNKYMLLTRFCRRPKGDRPCGLCGPCTDVVIAGMAWRLPLRSRMIAYIQVPFRKWWRNNYLSQQSKFGILIKNMLKHRY